MILICSHLPPRGATRLNLKLWGTVTDESNRHTCAVIEDLTTRRQALYRPGASIQSATVKSIARESVVLSVDGRDEALVLAALSSGAPDSFNPGPGDITQGKISLARSLLEQAARVTSYTMNPAGLTRYLESEHPADLLITTLWPNSVFRRLGLRNGDVLTSVAGMPVTSAKDVAVLLTNLSFAADTAVQIKRDDRLQLPVYDVQ